MTPTDFAISLGADVRPLPMGNNLAEFPLSLSVHACRLESWLRARNFEVLHISDSTFETSKVYWGIGRLTTSQRQPEGFPEDPFADGHNLHCGGVCNRGRLSHRSGTDHRGDAARGRRCALGSVVSTKGPQMAGADRRLQDLGIQLPAAPTPFGSYVETVQTGNLLFLSGIIPVVDHKPKYLGRLGKELDTEGGREAARTAALSALAAAKQHLGSLDRITRVVRLGIFVATFGDFFDQPKVADGASDLFRDVFGSKSMAVRSVIGVASLPLGVPVGVEVIFEVAEQQE